MTFELLKKLNWLDIFIIIIFIRSLYIGLKRGLVDELFKLLGVFFAIVISLHYYTRIGDFLNSRSPLPLDLADFFSLLILSSTIIILFKFTRDGFGVLIKTEVRPILNKWAGLIFSGLRAFALSSLIMIILFSSSINYLKTSIRNSFSQNYLLNLAPRIYSSCFENLIVKFFPNEQLNTALFDSLEAAEKK